MKLFLWAIEMKISVYVLQGALFIEQEQDDGDVEDLIRIEPEQVDELIDAIKKAQAMLVSH